jgi:peptide/nickel transport system substrate-binding protein
MCLPANPFNPGDIFVRVFPALRRLMLPCLMAAVAVVPASAESVLRVVLVNDLASLDPVLSTAAFVRNHGFLVYDQLFGLDSKGEPQPQMVQSFTVSPDGRNYVFTLRDGLVYHDGSKVRAIDAVASIKRWAQRDVVGKALAAATASMQATDEKTFTISLSRPFALVTEALARPTASALFVMPERLANTPVTTAITEATGSGPFIFEADKWRVGDRAIYRKNPAYIPRAEPADGLAGGKVVKIDRLEWRAISDPATAAAALQAGEIDLIEQPSADLIPTLERNPAIRTLAINPVGSMIWLRLNHAQKPFNDARAREALLYLVNQKENLDAAGIRLSEQVPYCPAYFLCGSPLESSAGAKGLREADVGKARALLKEAGYNGEPVVFMNAADSPVNNAVTLTMGEAFKKAGLNMDIPTMDWATLTQRRNKREPADQGGWSLFVTVANVLDSGSPLTNLYLASPCDGGLAGWPCDAELETLRRSWWEEGDKARRHEIMEKVHARAYEVLPYINAGQFRYLAAYRTSVVGMRSTVIPVFWGVEKASTP